MRSRSRLRRAVLAATLAVASAGGVRAQTCADETDGWRLRACLRAAHAPAALLSAESATTTLASSVDVRVHRDSTLRADSTFVPADSSWTVETWWEVTETPHLAAIDDATTAHRPGALPPGWTVRTPEPAAPPHAHAVGTPLPADALPAPVGAHLDLHAAYPSAFGGPPLPDRRGDVARAALYVRTVYPLHVEASGEWPASAHARGPRIEDLLADHEADPPDDAEHVRHDRAAAVQGNANPFVLSPALARRAFPQRPPVDRAAPPLWINEVHATNDGRDTGEGVEVAGPARTDLAGWRLVLYGGRGQPYDPYDDEITATPALSGALPAEGSLGAAWLPIRGMWNRCNGVALFDPDAALVQFVSYGGCRFNAASGPVAGAAEAHVPGGAAPSHPDSLAWTTPTLDARGRTLQEWTRMPAGTSLQLTGAGTAYADFAWTLAPATPGRLGDHQAPGATTGAARLSTAAVCPGLTGTDALACVADGYRPARLLSLADSKDRLYDTVERTERGGTPGVVGLYSGLFVPFDCNPSCDPSQDVYNGNAALGANQEHVWPRSHGTDGNAAERDLHHLFPARSAVNSARGNLRFAEVPDARASAWYRDLDVEPAPPPDLDAWSERDGRAAWEPRESAKGDVARALFYVAAVYADLVDLAWFEPQRETLLTWHAADPPSAEDQARSERVAQFQTGCAAVSCVNPFVANPSLAERAFASRPTMMDPALGEPILTLGPPRPNPSSGLVSFTLTAPHPVHVRAVVLDALGREIAIAFVGLAREGTEVRVETRSFPTGPYVLRVTSDGAPLSRRFTVAR